MNKLIRSIQTYLVTSTLPVLLTAYWSSVSKPAQYSLPVSILWEICAWNLIFWFFTLFIFLVLLVVNKTARELTINRIAGLKDRDERETMISGNAAKTTFITSISILIFLFFLSVFQFQVRHLPPEEMLNGKSKTMSISFGFKLFEDSESASTHTLSEPQPGAIILTKDIPLTKSSLLLLLIVWQLFSFRMSMRKQLLTES